jgi:hypothetical protein
MAIRAAVLALALPVALSAVHAAGGHHAVDDAALIELGQCEFEGWAERERDAARTLLHTGLGCRTGPVELGIGADRLRVRGSREFTSFSPQLKWATQVSAQWSAGVVLWGAWQSGDDAGYRGSTLLVPVSWRAADGLFLHLNAGRDFRRYEPDASRTGAALEWTPVAAWSLVAERYREGGGNFWRLGGRWSPTPAVAVDLSRAAGMDSGAPPWWTLGVKLAFGR